jgi:hypothetical protein
LAAQCAERNAPPLNFKTKRSTKKKKRKRQYLAFSPGLAFIFMVLILYQAIMKVPASDFLVTRKATKRENIE